MVTSVWRHAVLEVLLRWGDGLRVGDLQRITGLTRQAAQLLRRDYEGRHGRGALERVRGKRGARRVGYVAGPAFRPAYIRDDVAAYLDYLRGATLVSRLLVREAGAPHLGPWTGVRVHEALVPAARARPRACANVPRGLAARRAVLCDYQSKQGRRDSVVISPHALVFDGLRYHVRAHVHGTGNWVDLVLGRFLAAELTKEAWVGDAGDLEWHSFRMLQATINPALPEDVRQALREEYELTDDTFSFRERQPVLFYVRRRLEALRHDAGLRLWLCQESDG
jgi:hypothetical protein